MTGVVLISWRQIILQKQIDYGVKLGQVVLSLAKMELDNFYKNVIPVSEYFDQSGLLTVVNGERNPGEVYKDFRSSVLDILGSQENDSRLPNGSVPMAHSTTIDIPGVIVEAEPNNWQELGNEDDPDDVDDLEANTSNTLQKAKNTIVTIENSSFDLLQVPKIVNNNFDYSNLPPIIWVIGGPGSNKSTLCLKAVALNPGWSHFR